ncbi:MAG: flagellar export chaperone FlgN [Planctomycetota bacterium]|jgi:hypothetical protein
MSLEPVNTPSPSWDDQLIALLERQQQLVVRLGQLADQQGSLIEARRTDALLGLLAERQRIIDQFTASQEELSGLTVDLNARLEQTARSRADRIRALLDEIGHCLASVMQRDEQDQQTLHTGRAAVRQELSSLDAGTQARNAYLKPKPVVNRFADRRG